MENMNGDDLFQCDVCITKKGKSLGGAFKLCTHIEPEQRNKYKTKSMFGKTFLWTKCDVCAGTGIIIKEKIKSGRQS